MNSTLALRLERQHLSRKANKEEYLALYRDCQPGQNVYWNGFGQPPTLCFRADFDDLEFNRRRQLDRQLIKGRFAGGNLGWIVKEDLELFACLYRKPLAKPIENQRIILELIEREGPLNIQQMKEETGLLVKEITPALHRLQQAFLIYEDQYDGEWDRGWMRFEEMFPEVDPERYTPVQALKILLQRYAYRMVQFDAAMVRSFYKLPVKLIQTAIEELLEEGVLVEGENSVMLKTDAELLKTYRSAPQPSVFAIHRNDILYKSYEHILKVEIEALCKGLPYDCEPLQYLLTDGEFRGAVVGKFRNGPYDLNDVVCDLPERKYEILEAVRSVNYGKMPVRFMGEDIGG